MLAAETCTESELSEIKRTSGVVERSVAINGRLFRETVLSTKPDLEPAADFFVSRLSEPVQAESAAPSKRLNYIDLFCGGGGLSLGVTQASQFLGRQSRLLAAVDLDKNALELVKRQFRPLVSRPKSVEDLIRYDVDLSGNLDDFIVSPEIVDSQIAQFKGKVDLLVGGPPCQGHSNLNNRTRRFDSRNLLYLIMPAFAVALNVPHVIIENVPSINNAKEEVVPLTRRIFEANGYQVEDTVVNAADFGTAQTRSRHFLVASNKSRPTLGPSLERFMVDRISFDTICSDMPGLDPELSMIEANGQLSEENRARVDFLHDNNLFELPNGERPQCHQDEHTYPSVYGRIRGDQPMTTITTGFGSPGRGRYIHPRERRVINIREAGRLQGFPDKYWAPAIKADLKRAHFQKIVGDAVPPLLAYPLLASLIGHLE